MIRSSACAASLICMLLVAPAVADEVIEDFDDGAIDTEQFHLSIPDGFEINFINGVAEFVKREGTGNGFARISHRMTVFGDFDANVVVDRTVAGAGMALGLVASHLAPETGFTDVFFSGAATLNSLFLVPPFDQPASISTSDTLMTFRLRRVGDALFHEYDSGMGFVQLGTASHENLSGPVSIGLFLGQEIGNTAPQSGTVDDFTITGDRFSPPCGDALVAGDELCDDGDPTWQFGEYCTAECEILACGDPDDSSVLTASDALFVLLTAVGSASCDPCVCDVNGSGGPNPVTASDALIVLNEAVGVDTGIACPVCP